MSKKASQKEVSMLDGAGVLALVYPRTAAFDQPLPVFEFPKSTGLKLWVLPFCLRSQTLRLADDFVWPESGLEMRHRDESRQFNINIAG